MGKELWKGNEAIAEAAVRAGAQAFFGYPITPQTELLEYMSRRMPELNRVFLQAESEIAAIHMVFGAAAAGLRAMSSSSSPGISLMQEGLSYIAGSEVPCVLVDIMRAGPGLGNIQPSQGDYFQVTRSAGHGDYHPLVLAPSTVQEAVDLMSISFDLAFRYRQIVILLGDGTLGQLMEPVAMPPFQPLPTAPPTWALTGAWQRPPRTIASLHLDAEALQAFNLSLQAKLERIRSREVRWESYLVEDADLLLVAFGTVARIARTAVRQARAAGIRVGLLRPISLWPFPTAPLAALTDQLRAALVVEMNAGQMLDDVALALGERVPIQFMGRMGGVVPLPDEILAQLQQLHRTLRASAHLRSRPPAVAKVLA